MNKKNINFIFLEDALSQEFDKSINRLAGAELGEYIYVKYVREFVDWDKQNIIVFPKYLKAVSISFVKGFTKQIFKKIHKDEFNEFFAITGKGSVDFVDRFIKSIYI